MNPRSRIFPQEGTGGEFALHGNRNFAGEYGGQQILHGFELSRLGIRFELPDVVCVR